MAVFHVNFMSEALGRTVPLCVILPTGKVYFGDMPRREAGKPFKTLYLLHGIIGAARPTGCTAPASSAMPRSVIWLWSCLQVRTGSM